MSDDLWHTFAQTNPNVHATRHDPQSIASRQVLSDLINKIADLLATAGKGLKDYVNFPRPEFPRHQDAMAMSFVNEEHAYDQPEQEIKARNL